MKVLTSLIIVFLCYSCKGQNLVLNKTDLGTDIGNIINEKKQGYWSYYDKSNILKKICYYKDNILEGKVVTFYKNGNINTIISFSSGRVNGEVNFYSTKGELLATYIYNNDILKEVQYYVIDVESPPRNHGFIPTW